MPPMPSYADITAQQIRDAIARGVPATHAAAAACLAGDHWQDGDGWIGTQPYTGEEGLYVKGLIEKSFVSANVVGEVVARHVAGVVGREPSFAYTPARALQEDEEPSADEQALIDEAEAAVTTWWDRVTAPEVISAATAYALIGARGVLRAYVPVGRLIATDAPDGPALVLPPGDLIQQLERIELEALDAPAAAVLRDQVSGQDVGAVATPPVASPFAIRAATLGPVELHYLDDSPDPLTIIEAGTDVPRSMAALPLGGRLLIAQIERAPLITPQILQLQRALNHSLTMMLHNTDLAGSVERIITNGQRPGHFDRSDADASGWVFVAEPFQVGAGVTSFVQGVPIVDENGRTTAYTNPGVQRIPPVGVESFTDTQDQLYAAILAEAHQRHALIAGDAAASGESRKQARADFAASLDPTARAVEGALRALLEAVLRAASVFAGQPGRFDGLRAEVTCQRDTGPLSGEDMRELREQHGADLLSAATTMARLGVDDVDAELGRIATERDERQARAPQLAPVAPEGTVPDTDSAPTVPAPAAASPNGRLQETIR